MFTELETSDKHAFKHFVRQQKRSLPNQYERAFIVKNQQKIIGLARIQGFGSQAWLRGLYIEPEARSKGYGTGLVKFVITQLKSGYCVGFIEPKRHLFYQKLGFMPWQAEQLEPGLNQKYQHYLKSKPSLMAWAYKIPIN